ncbi:hypothetical protein [uncultured Erythrobacter sp.]|uniref:hypothetical protein n=1 Tax=uncultured Erythrobacter sp. TaxID=263913 RepID=UPI00260661B6|nr:hypothetical protein [uncultured Erythrobacter sp.]
MTQEEWANSNDAEAMLEALYSEEPKFFEQQVSQLHRFLIACCWKHAHLIPQQGLRDGLRGAERWIVGEIDDEELNRLNWYAEADAFFLDYAKAPAELDQIRKMITAIGELDDLSFDDARALLLEAAYFAEGSMIYPQIRPAPWFERVFTSKFLCAKLLREHVKPPLTS